MLTPNGVGRAVGGSLVAADRFGRQRWWLLTGGALGPHGPISRARQVTPTQRWLYLFELTLVAISDRELDAAIYGRLTGDKLSGLWRGFSAHSVKIGGREPDAPEATHTVSDARRRSILGRGGLPSRSYDTTLGLGEDAWDIYLLYGPAARWDGPAATDAGVLRCTNSQA